MYAKKILAKIKQYKKVLLIVGVILLLIIFIVIIYAFLGGLNEEKLKNSLKEIVTDFYENFYYQKIGLTDEERVSFLENYKDSGIKISLDNLSHYIIIDEEKTKKFAVIIKELKTRAPCDKQNIKITIFPISPYEKSDYKVEITLDCKF